MSNASLVKKRRRVRKSREDVNDDGDKPGDDDDRRVADLKRTGTQYAEIPDLFEDEEPSDAPPPFIEHSPSNSNAPNANRRGLRRFFGFGGAKKKEDAPQPSRDVSSKTMSASTTPGGLPIKASNSKAASRSALHNSAGSNSVPVLSTSPLAASTLATSTLFGNLEDERAQDRIRQENMSRFNATSTPSTAVMPSMAEIDAAIGTLPSNWQALERMSLMRAVVAALLVDHRDAGERVSAFRSAIARAISETVASDPRQAAVRGVSAAASARKPEIAVTSSTSSDVAAAAVAAVASPVKRENVYGTVRTPDPRQRKPRRERTPACALLQLPVRALKLIIDLSGARARNALRCTGKAERRALRAALAASDDTNATYAGARLWQLDGGGSLNAVTRAAPVLARCARRLVVRGELADLTLSTALSPVLSCACLKRLTLHDCDRDAHEAAAYMALSALASVSARACCLCAGVEVVTCVGALAHVARVDRVARSACGHDRRAHAVADVCARCLAEWCAWRARAHVVTCRCARGRSARARSARTDVSARAPSRGR
jgi:hypothetical protein